MNNQESHTTIKCNCGEILIDVILDKKNKNINLGNGFSINYNINDNIILKVNAILKCPVCGKESCI